MNTRRQAPQPQCSFQVHKGPPYGQIRNSDSTNAVGKERMKLNSYLNNDCKSKSPPKTKRETSPRSIVYTSATAAAPPPSANTTSYRDISPMRRSKAPGKTVIRRANSFDDSFGHISVTDLSAALAPRSPQHRGGKRKEKIIRSNSLPAKIKKTVSFNEKYDTVHEIERTSDLPSGVIPEIWWVGDGYQEIKREYEALVYLLDQNIHVDEQYDSVRGLQKHTEHGAWEMFEKQRNARNAVLQQQDIYRKQKSRGNNNSNNDDLSIEIAIAQVYMDETLHLRDEAIQQAMTDYTIAMEYMNVDTAARMESLDGSISDIALLMEEDYKPTPETTKNSSSRKKSDATVQPVRRTRSNTCFVDSKMNNNNEVGTTLARRNAFVQQTMGEQSDHSSTSERSVQLTSVFEESILIMSDEDEDDEDGEWMGPSDDDARSTDTIPTQVCSARQLDDHVATKVRFATKTQKIKRMKVKDVESDTRKRWYSKTEIVDIATAVNNVVESVEKNGQSINNSDVGTEIKYSETRRGLEKSTELGARKLYERRRYALNAVLSVQSQQRHHTNDAIDVSTKMIADAYISATNEAHQEAIKFGKQDAKEARKHRIKRRSGTAPSPDLSLQAALERRRSSAYGRLELVGTDEEDKSITSETSRESSLSNDDCNDFSMRSILNLPVDADDLIDTTPISSVNSLVAMNNSNSRLSESHAPSRRFVQAAAESLNRQVQLCCAKEQTTYNVTPYQRDGKATKTKAMPFRYPYDVRDDSTNDDSIELFDVSEAKEKASPRSAQVVGGTVSVSKSRHGNDDSFLCFKVKPANIKEMTLASGLVHMLRNAISVTNGENKARSGIDSSFVRFKVKPSDVEEMTLANGVMVHVLRNAVKSVVTSKR